MGTHLSKAWGGVFNLGVNLHFDPFPSKKPEKSRFNSNNVQNQQPAPGSQVNSPTKFAGPDLAGATHPLHSLPTEIRGVAHMQGSGVQIPTCTQCRLWEAVGIHQVGERWIRFVTDVGCQCGMITPTVASQSKKRMQLDLSFSV